MTEISPLISIVVPVYNVERYLPKCIESIISQTYTNIEVLLVNDGSSDSSPKICDEYAQKDSRIKVFHRLNSGKGETRKFGVMSSTGEYIMFVDSDDWMAEDGVELLYDSLSDDVDIVVGISTFFLERSGEYKRRSDMVPMIEYGVIDRETSVKSIMLNRLPRAPWARLFRRSLFTEDSFPNTKRMQDVLMNIEVACHCRKVKFVDKNVYFYRDDSGSSEKKTFNRSREFYIQIAETTHEILLRNGIYDSVKDVFARFAFRLYYDARHTHFFDSSEPLVSEIKKNIDPKTLKWRRRVFLKSFDSKVIRFFLKGMDRVAQKLKRKRK